MWELARNKTFFMRWGATKDMIFEKHCDGACQSWLGLRGMAIYVTPINELLIVVKVEC